MYTASPLTILDYLLSLLIRVSRSKTWCDVGTDWADWKTVGECGRAKRISKTAIVFIHTRQQQQQENQHNTSMNEWIIIQ